MTDKQDPKPCPLCGGTADRLQRERLAEYAHDAWSGWMRHLWSKTEILPLGQRVIPKWVEERWSRQMHTPYVNLPKDEKDSDRVEADKIIAIVTRLSGEQK